MQNISDVLYWSIVTILLFVAWQNTHWSAVTLLGLNLIMLEIASRNIKLVNNLNQKLISALDEINNILKKLFKID